MMKRIKKLTLNELEEYFDVLSEDECRNIIGGWYCFSYCLDYLGIPGEYFNLYYGALYGSPEYAGGVNGEYALSVLTQMGVSYSTPEYLGTGDIIAINDGTHAVIYDSKWKDNEGNVIIRYYEPQVNEYREYNAGKHPTIEAVRIN